MWGGGKILSVRMFHALCISPHCGVARLLSVWTLIKNPAKRILKVLFLPWHSMKGKKAKGMTGIPGLRLAPEGRGD